MVTGSERFGPLNDYTANCRPVLLSERAPHRYKTANFRQQHSDWNVGMSQVLGAVSRVVLLWRRVGEARVQILPTRGRNVLLEVDNFTRGQLKHSTNLFVMKVA
jgi:hypothetical protein